MKKLTITLVFALMLSSMSVSAWAAPSKGDLSCLVNTISSSQCSAATQNGSECTTGTDANSLLDQLKSLCGITENTQGCNQVNSATIKSGSVSPEEFLESCGVNIQDTTENDDAASSPSCPSAALATDNKAVDSAAVTQAATKQASSNEVSANKSACAPVVLEKPAVIAAQEDADVATCNDSGCDVSEDCALANCDVNGEECYTSSCDISGLCTAADLAAVSASDATLFDFLNGMLAKCGINSDFISYLFSGCINQSGSDTEEPSPSPSDSAEETPDVTPTPIVTATPDVTPTPSDNGTETPAPSDNASETPAPSDNIDNLSYEEQVVALVNEQRAANGLAPLTLSAELSNVARAKSQDMHDNNYFSHTSPTYGSPFDMMTSFGITYRAAGENIAMGYATPQAVVTAWMNSEGHRANILNSAYTQIGVGYVADGNYWTQEFIG